MMATALGAAVSDALEDGRVVSGVGGQYNFVALAQALDGARSILMLRATRIEGGRARSNIRWAYGHTTIPRHLRDIFITEYGIADLRGKTDRECVLAMLAIADARYTTSLSRRPYLHASFQGISGLHPHGRRTRRKRWPIASGSRASARRCRRGRLAAISTPPSAR